MNVCLPMVYHYRNEIDRNLSVCSVFGVCEQIAKVSSSRYFDYLTEINIDSSPRHTNHSLVLFYLQRNTSIRHCGLFVTFNDISIENCVMHGMRVWLWIHPLNSSLVEAEYHSLIKITEPKGIFGFSSHHHQVYFMHGQIQIQIDYRKTNVFDMRLNLDIS